MYEHAQVAQVEQALKRQQVDALFVPHCDFGCEEVVGQIAKRMNVPVLLWGNRDPYPDYPGGKDRDTQCGTLASSKSLQRFGVPFSYILNSEVDGPRLKKALRIFARLCAARTATKCPVLWPCPWRQGTSPFCSGLRKTACRPWGRAFQR